MGVVENVGFDRFPKQGPHLGATCRVMFGYSGACIAGEIVRDDMEEPLRTIIRLDDGRYVMSTECQYSPSPTTPVTAAVEEPEPDSPASASREVSEEDVERIAAKWDRSPNFIRLVLEDFVASGGTTAND